MHETARPALTDTVSGCPATPSRYIETAERIGPVLDVQAVLGGAPDGGPLVHVGDVALTPSGTAALCAHLGELLAVLSEQQVTD